MVAAAIGSPLQVLDRGGVRPLLIAPTVGKNDVLVAIATSPLLLLEEQQNISPFQ